MLHRKFPRAVNTDKKYKFESQDGSPEFVVVVEEDTNGDEFPLFFTKCLKQFTGHENYILFH